MGSWNEVENNLNTERSRIIVPLLAFSANRSLKPAISARQGCGSPTLMIRLFDLISWFICFLDLFYFHYSRERWVNISPRLPARTDSKSSQSGVIQLRRGLDVMRQSISTTLNVVIILGWGGVGGLSSKAGNLATVVVGYSWFDGGGGGGKPTISGLTLGYYDACAKLCSIIELTWDNFVCHSHYQTIVTKALKLLGLVFRVWVDFKDPFSLRTLYCSLVRPFLEFASVVWCPHQITYIDKIEIQKKSHVLCFIVFPVMFQIPPPSYNFRCLLFGLETFQHRKTTAQITFTHKLLIGNVDAPDNLNFICFSTPSRGLRSRELLRSSFRSTGLGATTRTDCW